MKTLRTISIALVVVLFWVVVSQHLCAQSKPADPTAPAGDDSHQVAGLAQATPGKAKIPVTIESRDVLRAAIHKQDQAQKQISDLTAQFVQMQNQATTKMQTLQAQEKQAAEAVSEAKTKAYAAAKLDPGKYDLDLDTMEFSAKTPTEAKK